MNSRVITSRINPADTKHSRLERARPFVYLAVFVVAWLAVPGTHLVMDEGYRLLQTCSLNKSVSLPVYINYPGAELLGASLAEEVRPLPAHYGNFTGNGLTCLYSPALAVVSSCFHQGYFSLIPLLSGFFLWLFISKKLQQAGFSRLSAELIPLAGTPLLFYSLGFWSYPLGILLVFAAVKAAENTRPFTAYLLVAFAALFRIEYSIAFLIVILRLNFSWIKRLLYAIPALIILLAGNWILSGGEFLGTHVLASTGEQSLYGNTDMPLLIQKLNAAGKAFFPLFPGKTGTVWLIPGVILWLVWGLAFREDRVGSIATCIGLTLCLSAVVVWAVNGFAFLDGFSMKHPLMVFPVLWLLSVDTIRRSWRELAVLALLVLLLLPMHTDGPAWGVRHIFLPLFLIMWNLKPGKRKVLPVISFGILITGSALLFLGINRSRVESISTLAEASGNAVITTNWIIPGWLTDNMSNNTPVVYTSTEYQLAESMLSLKNNNPAVVCLQRDAANTVRILEKLGYVCSVKGEVAFGSSLSCIVIVPE